MKQPQIIVLLMLITFIGYGQTSQEEYNFITKGYRFTVDYGLDMKQGYQMRLLKQYNLTDNCAATISGFFRTVKGDLAGYLLTIKEGTFEKDICIPTENSTDEIWKQYDAILQSLPLSTQRYVTIAISRFLSQKPPTQTAQKAPEDSLSMASSLQLSEEGTGGIVIPKKTNPLLPSHVESINHHTIRFFPDPPQTAKDINGNLKLKICINKEGDVLEAIILDEQSSITDSDVKELVLANVRKYKFSLNVYAPDLECGYINYTFVKTPDNE